MDGSKERYFTKKQDVGISDGIDKLKSRLSKIKKTTDRKYGLECTLINSSARQDILSSKSPTLGSNQVGMKNILRSRLKVGKSSNRIISSKRSNFTESTDSNQKKRIVLQRHKSSFREQQQENAEMRSFRNDSRSISDKKLDQATSTSTRFKKLAYRGGLLKKYKNGDFQSRKQLDENLQPAGSVARLNKATKSNRYMNTGYSTYDNRFKKIKKTAILEKKSSKDKNAGQASNSSRLINSKLTKITRTDSNIGKLPRRNYGYGQKALKSKQILSLMKKIKNRKTNNLKSAAPLPLQPQNQNIILDNDLIADEDLKELDPESNIVSTIRKQLNSSAEFSDSKVQNLSSEETSSQLTTNLHKNYQPNIQMAYFQGKPTPKTIAKKVQAKNQNQFLMDELKNFKSRPYEGYDDEAVAEMIQLEDAYSVNPYYLDAENGLVIRWDMRAMLVDWMIEVAQDYHLKISTLHMAVNFLDRYSQKVGPQLKKNVYQLVGLTCINIATKIEVNFSKINLSDFLTFQEIFVPKFEEFGYSASNQFTVDQIRKMELEIVKVRPPKS